MPSLKKHFYSLHTDTNRYSPSISAVLAALGCPLSSNYADFGFAPSHRGDNGQNLTTKFSSVSLYKTYQVTDQNYFSHEVRSPRKKSLTNVLVKTLHVLQLFSVLLKTDDISPRLDNSEGFISLTHPPAGLIPLLLHPIVQVNHIKEKIRRL